jgi:hypothetical protein
MRAGKKMTILRRRHAKDRFSDHQHTESHPHGARRPAHAVRKMAAKKR